MDKNILRNILIEKLKVSRHSLSRYCRTKSIIENLVSMTNFLPHNSPINRRAWHIIYDIDEIQKCKKCNINHTKFNNNKWGYLDYCSIKCQRNSSEVIKNLNESLEKKYGKGITNPFQSKEIQEKIKNTNTQKYGVDHNLKSDICKQKIKDTCKHKYGVDNFAKSKEYGILYRKTIQDKYGVDHYSKTEEFKDKFKKTCISRYGVDHYMQDPEQCENILRKIHSFKDFKMPSGKLVRVQGFEDKALSILLEEGIEEDDILISKREITNFIGKIKYLHKDKERIYFPDFFIKSTNTVVEVKSTWTYDRNGKILPEDNVFFSKESAVKNTGMNFRLMLIR
jgi:hypothetical protein